MKTIQANILTLNKTTLVELTDQTILQINGGSRISLRPGSVSNRP